MRERFQVAGLLIALSLVFTGCDKGKKPYEEAEALFKETNYPAARDKAVELARIAPDSKYVSKAKEIVEKVDTIEKHLRDAEKSVQEGEYEEGIKSYKAALSAVPDDRKISENLKNAENTYSELKRLGDEAIVEFGAMLKARTTHNVSSEDWAITAQQVETARIRFSEKAKAMYKFPNGRKFLKTRLQSYMAEVEAALRKFVSASNAVQKASSYEKKVLAVDEYNTALSSFTETYGRPEVWLRDVGLSGFKKINVEGWMPKP